VGFHYVKVNYPPILEGQEERMKVDYHVEIEEARELALKLIAEGGTRRILGNALLDYVIKCKDEYEKEMALASLSGIDNDIKLHLVRLMKSEDKVNEMERELGLFFDHAALLEAGFVMDMTKNLRFKEIQEGNQTG